MLGPLQVLCFPRLRRAVKKSGFEQGVCDLRQARADLSPDAHIQAIANTSAFHFATVEQCGTGLYPSMAQRATRVEVMRILISIDPTEMMHFQIRSD